MKFEIDISFDIPFRFFSGFPFSIDLVLQILLCQLLKEASSTTIAD